jgi:hypothetical protein
MSRPAIFSGRATACLCLCAMLAIVHNTARPSAARAAQDTPSSADTLLPDGGFEDNGAGWLLCGGARVVDKQSGATDQMVHSGQRALRIGAPSSSGDSCGNGALGPQQVAAQDITIPSDASDFTLSFWYAIRGDWPVGKTWIHLSSAPYTLLGSTYLVDAIQMDELMPGWHQYRANVRPADLERLRGKTLYLALYVQFSQPTSGSSWDMYFDDLRAVPFTERTSGAPLPSDLSGDGARPIVLLGPGTASGKTGVYRIDSDGGNRARIADLDSTTVLPTWSPNGRQIAYKSGTISPETPLDPNGDTFAALASRVHVMNADGSADRQIYAYPGLPGTKEKPRNCLRNNTCTDVGTTALDALVTNIGWTPDSASIVSSTCRAGRWYNSDRSGSDGLCSIHVNPVPAAPNITTVIDAGLIITDADGVSWNKANKLLFAAGPSIPKRAKGIWEGDLAAQPPVLERLYGWATAYGSSSLDLRSNPDTNPVWSPDGRYFVTYRQAASNHYEPVTDTVGGLRVNYHIVLNDRQNPSAQRAVLLVDHGRLISRPSWSPDGKYVIYTLFNDAGTNADIWWLNVQSGETGPITRDGLSFDADWLPTHARGGPLPPSATPNPALTRKRYLPVAIRGGSGVPVGPIGVPVTFPTSVPPVNPTPRATPVNPTAVPPRGISGRIVYKGAPVNNVNINLESCNTLVNQCDILLRARTDANGRYSFTEAGSPGLFGFRVSYRNNQADGQNTPDARFMALIQGPELRGSNYGERVDAGTLDIADVPLTGPSNNASVATPATFSWTARGISGDKYQFVINAGGIGGTCSQADFDTITSFTIASLDCTFPSLSTGQAYTWQVFTQNADGSSGVTQRRTVTFTQ